MTPPHAIMQRRTDRPSLVAPGDMYGLVAGYTGDACNMALPAWPLLNLSGAAVFRNDSAALPAPALAEFMGGARQLFDAEICLYAKSPHMCMISSIDASLDVHNRSKLTPIWRYMLTNEIAPTPAAVAKETDVNCSMAVVPPTTVGYGDAAASSSLDSFHDF